MKQKSLRIILMVSVLLVLLLGITGPARAEEASSPNLTPEQWVGHTFLFLDLPADKRSEGYEIFNKDQAEQGFQGDRSVRIPYAQHVGKQVTVTDVVTYPAGDNNEYIVYLSENNTGEKLVGRTMRGKLDGLVLEADMTKARQQFLGKTIYLKNRVLPGVYDLSSGAAPAAVTTKIGSAAQVIDVWAGIQSQDPIWLIVMVNGQKATLPLAYSYTNQPLSTWQNSPPWQDVLFMENPRVTFGWPEALWEKIETGTVEVGMTKEQVRLSWGRPASIDENNYGPGKSVWNYTTKALTFDGDNLISLENTELGDTVAP
ncbi:MAG TPA: hypothetical protein PKA28_06225 [Methylomusa anaerophila]|uniref:Uncharacterized protein n=1 Tax=Methylomusa anaerophila TaxID=1930071 RepID=A0A348ALL0_9FIRM|nr:hypothetical protein [Methylomusa anaerophila]BBB91958.1 hypothetical protein MAMMFC1_02643 [Methylomusa anaerophila]HML88030.1 hypothetical protein [Methylomusa anaerophila]